mmetsp:Transcript_603/g.1060  ORF Transcript_603/g.1060 Transcript_603/m.1060 type:complete len:101 (+) Transcript_603:1046-1348(+)
MGPTRDELSVAAFVLRLSGVDIVLEQRVRAPASSPCLSVVEVRAIPFVRCKPDSTLQRFPNSSAHPDTAAPHGPMTDPSYEICLHNTDNDTHLAGKRFSS